MKDALFAGVNQFRCERKFFIENMDRETLEAMIKRHPAMFREIYCQRRVNSIYFDSIDLRHYFDNVNGMDRRLKVRVRWYGEPFGPVRKPTLEIKLKHNLHVGKLLYPLGDFTLDRRFSIGTIRRLFKESAVKEGFRLHLDALDFSLLNSYLRKYFFSADGAFRITVDSDMTAYKLFPFGNSFMQTVRDRENLILELKYNKLRDDAADFITGRFPFRMTRSSKYVTGIDAVRTFGPGLACDVG